MRSGFSRSHSATVFSGEELGPILQPTGLQHAREELEMGAVELAGAIADPHHVGRAVEPVAGQRVHPGQALLVGEDQCLVARPEVDLVQPDFGAQVDATCRHEAKGPVDFRRHALVAQPLGRRCDELLVPQVDLGEVGEATLGEGAQEIERRGGLLVRRHEARRVGAPRVFVECLVVHHVPAERVEFGVADALGRRRARLGELACDPSDLDHRHAGRVGERDRHLQDDLQLVADGIGREVGERLGTVARPGGGTPGRLRRRPTEKSSAGPHRRKRAAEGWRAGLRPS